MFRRTVFLDSKSWSAGGSADYQMASLPVGRVRHIVLPITATVKNTTGGAITVGGWELTKLINLITIQSERLRVNIRGLDLLYLFRQQYGKSCGTEVLGLADGATASFTAYFRLDLVDNRAARPEDFAQPTSLLTDKNISVTFSPNGLIRPSVEVTAASIRPELYLLPSEGDVLPPLMEIRFLDWTGQTPKIDGGLVTDILFTDLSSNSVTGAQYNNVTVEMDSVFVLNAEPFGNLVQDWNTNNAQSGAVGPIGDALDPAGAFFLPVLSPPPRYKMSKLPASEGQVALSFTGAATGARILTRTVKWSDDAKVNDGFKAMGIDNPVAYRRRSKTVSKSDLHPSSPQYRWLRGILPVRLGTK